MSGVNALPSFNAEPALVLDPVQQTQLESGLVLINTERYLSAAAWILDTFDQDASAQFPDKGAPAKFWYTNNHPASSDFDELGETIFRDLAPTVGYERLGEDGDIMELSGLILYPPNNPGYGMHRDSHLYDWPMTRITLSVEGSGNHDAANTGRLTTRPSDVLFQDLRVGISHAMDTLGHEQRRVAAFWDIPARRA